MLSICPFYQFKNEHKTLQAKITLIKKEQKNQINGIELAELVKKLFSSKNQDVVETSFPEQSTIIIVTHPR